MKKIFFLLFLLFAVSGYPQVEYKKIDSLRRVAFHADEDTSRIKAFSKLSEIYIDINRDSSRFFASHALDIATRNNDTRGLISAYKQFAIIAIYNGEFKEAAKILRKTIAIAVEHNIWYRAANLYYLLGIAYYNVDDYNKALDSYFKALRIAERYGYPDVVLLCYNAIGVVNKALGNYDVAIKYYLQSLALGEKLHDVEAISNAYNNVANIYRNQGQYKEALKYYEKALRFNLKQGDKYNVMQIYMNIGNTFKNLKQYDKAYDFFQKSLKIAKEIDNKLGLSNLLLNWSELQVLQHQYFEAIKNLEKSIQLSKEISNLSGLANAYSSLGRVYLLLADSLRAQKQKYLQLALENAERSYDLSKKLQNLNSIFSAVELLKAIYEKKGDYKNALYFANLSLETQHKLFNSDKFEVIEKMKVKYEREKAQLQIDKLKKEQKLKDQIIKNQKLKEEWSRRQTILLGITLFLLLFFLTYMIVILKKNKKLNKTLSETYKKLEEKSAELKKQYMKVVKQNIEAKVKAHEIEKQQKIISEINKELKKVNDRLIASEEELKLQNEILFQKNKEISKQQAEIKEVVRQFEDTINNLEDVYFRTDRYFRYKKVSPSIANYLGLLSADDIIGKPLSEFWVITEDKLKRLTYRLLRDKYLKDYLFQYKTLSGSIGYATINARVLFDEQGHFTGVEGIIRDVTDHVKYQDKIKELVLQKEVLINNINLAIYYKDALLRYIEVNNKYAALLGKEREEIIGKTDNELVSPEIAEEYESLDKKVIATKKILADYVRMHRLPDGTIQWISTTKIPFLDAQGNVAGIIGVVTDITKFVEYENEIKAAKEKVEKAHKQLTDNITYARTIQQAMLPQRNVIEKYFPHHFILYLPKDIVSGDFYYFSKVGNKIIFAAADCTGHGVSGGFLSMLGITHLNHIIIDKGITNPAEILNMLREQIKNTFKMFGSENNNGMDIALCTFDSDTHELVYSGAFNPMWLVRNGTLTEFRAGKNPIGFYFREDDFTNHHIKIEKGDMIYLFSDGFADQFGGPANKKYSMKRFQQLLITVSERDTQTQKQLLLQEFSEWKKDYEQTDDVLVMGIKF